MKKVNKNKKVFFVHMIITLKDGEIGWGFLISGLYQSKVGLLFLKDNQISLKAQNYKTKFKKQIIYNYFLLYNYKFFL